MIFITGDCHANFYKIEKFCQIYPTTIDDTIIILGDAGINYFKDMRDKIQKYKLSQLPITLFCIQGNHEERPENIESYKIVKSKFGEVYMEDEYPNLLFGINGNIYNFDNKKAIVLGGAYSVDKEYRLSKGWEWFPNEQMSKEEQEKTVQTLDKINWKIDYVFSHTCPYNIRPIYLFLNCIDQKTVDNSMEIFLQKIADKLTFEHWFFGHFHDEMDKGKYSMLYNEIIGIEYFIEYNNED